MTLAVAFPIKMQKKTKKKYFFSLIKLHIQISGKFISSNFISIFNERSKETFLFLSSMEFLWQFELSPKLNDRLKGSNFSSSLQSILLYEKFIKSDFTDISFYTILSFDAKILSTSGLKIQAGIQTTFLTIHIMTS